MHWNFFNMKIFSEEDFVSSVTNSSLTNETMPKEDFSVPSTSCSSNSATLMETFVKTEQPSNSPHINLSLSQNLCSKFRCKEKEKNERLSCAN